MKLQLKVLSMVLMGASSATLLCAQDDPNAKPAQSRSIVTPSAASAEQLTNRLKATSGGASSQVAEIAKMSEAGVDEKSILAYIDGLPQSRVKADDIIYLHDKGISTTVINAWLQHANTAPAVQTQVAAAPAAQAAVQNAPVAQAPATPPTSTPVYVSPEPAPAYTGPTVVYTSPSPYYYPYYYPYYGGGPYISLGFYGRPFYGGFRGGFYPHHFGGGFHGGFHGGGIHVVGGGGHHWR
jgi:hypothetical protein